MQTTLRIHTKIFRRAKAAAAHERITLTRFIEQALERELKHRGPNRNSRLKMGDAERNRMMNALLRRTAHFRMGQRPSREEKNA